MNSKIIIQILLIVTAITILSATFYYYFYEKTITSTVPKSDNPKKELINNNSDTDLDEIENSNSNLLNNISYENVDAKGNKYQISASTGEIKDLDSNIIYMSDVVALVYLKNLDTLKIVSNNAIFNSIDFNSNFYNNVQLNFLDHQLNSEKLDLKFDENLLIIKEKVLYQSLDTKIFADAIVIDLITKNSKIFMNDKEKKIKILNN
jgi:hypothetical protein